MPRIISRSPPRERTKRGKNHIGPCKRKWATRENKESQKPDCAKARANRRAPRESRPRLSGQKECNTAARKTSAAGHREHNSQRRLEAIETVEISCAMNNRFWKEPREINHQRKKSDGAPNPHTAEGMRSGLAQNRQTNRYHNRKNRRADERHADHRDNDRPKTSTEPSTR